MRKGRLFVDLAYKLDDLGWVEFEELVQTLLIAKLGLGVESWSGTGDWGRDAYYQGELRYPTDDKNRGPFIFQAKFVSGANAAGNKSQVPLTKAVQSECRRIRSRKVASSKRRVPLSDPKHYSLFTNCVVNAEFRDKILNQLKSEISGAEIHIHDGKDICNWINLIPKITSRFPQLFTIRDIQQFLAETVSKGILSRSEVAISMAHDSARIFVPTTSYTEAVNKLNTHRFVVLEGPPEMGKTTIARIIALSKIMEGWEAIECKNPKEFHETYDKQKPQVFIADDFFGRTEYEASRVSRWNDELPTILRRLNETHWLVLTSRAHLIQIGKRNLDISGFNDVFPLLSEVLVDAGKQTQFEKAKILYRHAKAANLSEEAKTVLKRHLYSIINHAHFTPLRITKLIKAISK